MAKIIYASKSETKKFNRQNEIETYSRELDRRSYKWIEEDRSPRREKERGERMRGKS